MWEEFIWSENQKVLASKSAAMRFVEMAGRYKGGERLLSEYNLKSAGLQTGLLDESRESERWCYSPEVIVTIISTEHKI